MKPRLASLLALCVAMLCANAVHAQAAQQRSDYPLLVAASKGNVAEVKQLLDAGVSPDFACHGVTPLIACASNGHQEVAELLVARGAHVNLRSENGPTALMVAAARGYAELVQFLLDHGAEPNLKASFVWTQLTLTGEECRDLDQLGVVDELCTTEDCCMTALCVASDEKTRDILIQYGATE